METQETNDNVVIEDPKAVLAALERAKGDAKKFREEKEQLEKAVLEKNEAIEAYSRKLIKEKVAQKIASEGISDAERILKFININELSLSDDLELIGFEDKIDALKKDLPEVFDAKLRVGGQADTATKTSINTKLSASQLQAAKILGVS